MDIRKKKFSERTVMHWNRLPREVVESPSVEIFMSHMDTDLCDLLWGSCFSRGLELRTS